jgi:hypothetical protein
MANPMPNTSGLWRGRSGGRPPGTPNRATLEVRSFCRRLVTDVEYRASFEKRLRAGELPPALEQLVWFYAYGKPAQSLAVTNNGVSLAAIIAGRVPDEDDEDGQDGMGD